MSQNDQLFVQGRVIQNEPPIDCGVDISTMHYNPNFDFEKTVQEHPKDSSFNLEHFDSDAGNEIYDAAKSDVMYFLTSPHFLDASKHLPYLAYKYKTSIICYEISKKKFKSMCHYLFMLSPETEQRKQLLYFCIAKKGRCMILYGVFLFTYRSYTRFPHIPVCIPEFSILVILLTFTYHLYTRTVIYQPHTRIFTYTSCIPNCENPHLCALPWSDIFFETWVIFLGYLSACISMI